MPETEGTFNPENERGEPTIEEVREFALRFADVREEMEEMLADVTDVGEAIGIIYTVCLSGPYTESFVTTKLIEEGIIERD